MSNNWWPDDITSPEGTHVHSLISMYDFDQLISDPTHILSASSSCIDLIFNGQHNLAVDNGIILPFMPAAITKLHTVILIL